MCVGRPAKAGFGVLFATLVVALGALAPGAAAAELPDGRAYELVSPASMNGVVGSIAYPSPDGNVVDWSGLGGCCGATNGGEQLYQSRRGPEGWTTIGLTPAPKESLEGFTEGQSPVFWSRDLGTTVYSTPETYDPGDPHPGSDDLYAQAPGGALSWISQGPLSAAAPAAEPTFDGADPTARLVLFSSAASLTPDATGLDPEAGRRAQYLYARDLAAGTTTLVNVKDDGTLVSPYGAILGDGTAIGTGLVANQFGSTTNAVSADGRKIFFESPPPEVTFPVAAPPHLYVRDLEAGTTTAVDDPSSPGFARYEGAAEDGSLVFFRSDEGLGGSAADLELYAFNTTANQIGVVPPGAAIPISDGAGGALDGHLLGISAISNDGSHVYFVAEGVLTAEPNGNGQTAQASEPNFYAFDTRTGATAFIATLGPEDIAREFGARGPLISQPDLGRPAVPTPDGDVMVFESKSDLTGENPEGPTTELTAEASEGETVIEVADTTGIVVGREILLGSPLFQEKYRVKAVGQGTKIELERPLTFTQSAGTAVTQLGVGEVYRYVAADGRVTCLSCLGPGVRPVEASALTGMGGSYAPANLDATMNAAGTQVFFMSVEALVPAASGGAAMHVYEWEDGRLYLLSEPHATESAFVFGSTPSGDDVFITSGSQLVPEAEPNRFHTYDVRVGGGFPPRPEPGETCDGGGCPGAGTAPGPLPAPRTDGPVEPAGPKPAPSRPSFRLAAPNRAALLRAARSGRLALRVTAAEPGSAVVRAFAPFGRAPSAVGSARVTFAPRRLTRIVTLALSRPARERLAAGPLTLTIEVRDPKTGEVALERMELGARADRRAGGGKR